MIGTDSDLMDELASGKVRGLETAKRVRFVLQVLLHTSSRYLSHLRQITRVIDALEDELQESTRNREVLELLKYQKSLTFFTTALRSNELMMERLQRSQWFAAYPEDEDLLEDVITENRQAIDMTNIQANILSSMMDAFASIISNNLNRVMKLLASITIVVSLPTMVASFFGMNVRLPFAGHPWAFLVDHGDRPVRQLRRAVRLLETRLALSARRPGHRRGLRRVALRAARSGGRLMDEEERREAAVKRLKAKREFWGHVVAYVLVNGLLVVIWAVTSDSGHFWPMWSMLGWGIGLGFHAWDTFQKPISEEAIRKEMEKGTQ